MIIANPKAKFLKISFGMPTQTFIKIIDVTPSLTDKLLQIKITDSRTIDSCAQSFEYHHMPIF
ncbi:MAG: hypothetical protein OI74_04420 [Gammaproteobacteria bacterium (ex Lamellibrachia satsuma)]|nr:MAG: hypothetical protein NV67_13820 [Gammaproteobacteria bacterium (ex Lamellibrachia satsuma)]RRS34751.1 MAG: hypothetical protein OI74_04420 [Gammaproteobacteria bacterium (ex Lamellibrachia satsuma)]